MSLLRQDVRLPESSIHDFGRDMVVALQVLWWWYWRSELQGLAGCFWFDNCSSAYFSSAFGLGCCLNNVQMQASCKASRPLSHFHATQCNALGASPTFNMSLTGCFELN